MNRERRSLPVAHFVAASFALLPFTARAQAPAATPNEFFKRGAPAFIVGTAGNDFSDRAIRTQAVMVRDMLFPGAEISEDTKVDIGKGPAAWPANPVLYGGPHVNHVLAKLDTALPFRMERGKLAIGDQTFEGDEYRLIAVVPSRAADGEGPGYPEFLLYAGSGAPGVGEINWVSHGGESILVADSFGRLLAGGWRESSGGAMIPSFPDSRARRIAWRTVDRELKTRGMRKAAPVHVRFPEQLPASGDENKLVEACMLGLSRAAQKLGGVSGANVTVYVYPDLGSIASLTGKRGSGHAVIEARVLHVVRADPASGGGFEALLAHEGTHALAYDAWGATGTSLLGEGLAVWAAESYAGTPLDDWKRRAPEPLPPVADLLGNAFRQMPENQSYPLAGVFVEAAIEKLGVAKVRQHLNGATASTWEDACKAAGTSSRDLEKAFRAAVKP